MFHSYRFQQLKKHFGFTLAEILITLGIIGIVSAITIPTLMLNIRHKTATTRLAKFYSNMKQMLLLAEDEHGSVNSWDTSLPYSQFLDTYFIPYLKGSKEGTRQDTIYFPDGSSVRIVKGRCMDMEYDINGNNPPNSRGYDRFRFLLCDASISEWCADEGFCSYRKSYTDKTNRIQLLELCKQNAAYCSALLEHDHWKFLSDYPYK